MHELGSQRCFRHPQREAAARCPTCRKFFCRECVTEHAGKVICSTCLSALPTHSAPDRVMLRRLGFAAFSLAGLLLVWLAFFGVGHWLAHRPDPYHDGSLWRDATWDQP